MRWLFDWVCAQLDFEVFRQEEKVFFRIFETSSYGASSIVSE